MESIVWPEIKTEEVSAEYFPDTGVTAAPLKEPRIPPAFFGLLYSGGILWGAFASTRLTPKISEFVNGFLQDFLNSCGTGSILNTAISFFVPAALILAAIFLSGFSAVGFIGASAALLIKGGVYGLTASFLLQEKAAGMIRCALLLAPFEALGSFLLILFASQCAQSSLQLLRYFANTGDSPTIKIGKAFGNLFVFTLLLGLFAFFSAAICAFAYPRIL